MANSFLKFTMGQTLSEPVTTKDTACCANASYRVGSSCMQGWRVDMEDAHTHILSLPNDAQESKRIMASGGWVEFNRVNGNLALSRALGDFIYKKNLLKTPEEQIVTAYPDVEVLDITEDLEFVLLACDGIWDVMSNFEVCQFVHKRIRDGMEPELICEELMNSCLSPDGHTGNVGGDNMTVILVCLLHNKSYEDLAVRCGGKRKTPVETVGDIQDQSVKVVTPCSQGSSGSSTSRLGLGFGLRESETPEANL